MGAYDHLDAAALHPGLHSSTWFGTWTPAQIYCLHPARSEPADTSTRDPDQHQEGRTGRLFRVNFFGCGAGASAFASAA